MGTYYLAVCEEALEYIDPGRIGESGRKWNDVVNGLSANVVAYAMMTRWRGKHVRYVGDSGSNESHVYESVRRGEHDGTQWADITDMLLNGMVENDDLDAAVLTTEREIGGDDDG